MKVRIQIVVEYEDKQDIQITEEVGCIYRDKLTPANLGLNLAEGKELLAEIQKAACSASS